MIILYRFFQHQVFRFVLIAGIVFLLVANINAQDFFLLGTLGGTSTTVHDVSSDGKVVGKSNTASSSYGHPFLWTKESGMQDLGSLGGLTGEAFAISADGSVVVGYSADSLGYYRAFYWTASSGMQRIDSDAWNSSEAHGVSDDGKFVVGYGRTTDAQEHAFIWDATSGISDLGTATDGSNSKAFDVSLDGSVVVGNSGTADRWSQTDGWTDVSGWYYFEVHAVTPDGLMIVGASRGSDYLYLSSYWTEASGFVRFGGLGSTSSYGNDVSADGQIIVGNANLGAAGVIAFRWTETTGMEDINVLYAHLVPDTLKLSYADAISPNGRYIAGTATLITDNTKSYAYLLDTGAPSTLIRDEPVHLPEQITLDQNYPNPFNPATSISFSLPSAQQVSLKVFDLTGRQVDELVSGKLNAGQHRFTFDAGALPSGIYFYVLQAGSFKETKRMILLK